MYQSETLHDTSIDQSETLHGIVQTKRIMWHWPDQNLHGISIDWTETFHGIDQTEI